MQQGIWQEININIDLFIKNKQSRYWQYLRWNHSLSFNLPAVSMGKIVFLPCLLMWNNLSSLFQTEFPLVNLTSTMLCNGSGVSPDVLKGKAVVVMRGDCTFSQKAVIAQNLGARSLLIASNKNLVGHLHPTVFCQLCKGMWFNTFDPVIEIVNKLSVPDHNNGVGVLKCNM